MTLNAQLRPLLVIAALALIAGCKKEIEIPVDPPEARKA